MRIVSKEAVVELVDRYLADRTFREAFTRDADGAVRDAGFVLDPAELQALHAAVALQDGDHALQPRIAKSSFGS